jgi:hypothetical protein
VVAVVVVAALEPLAALSMMCILMDKVVPAVPAGILASAVAVPVEVGNPFRPGRPGEQDFLAHRAIPALRVQAETRLQD